MKVVNIRKGEKYTVYCGRPSILGNPFIVGKDGTRDEVIAKFREHALNNSAVKYAIAKLKETDILGCYCKPLPCHCDEIINIYKYYL